MLLTRCCWLLIIPLLACSGTLVLDRCKPACTGSSICDSSTRRCIAPVADAGVGCVTDTQCPAPTRCVPATRRCVACLTSADCAAGSCDQATNECVALPDSCATARTLDLSSGKVMLTADTTRANDDTRLFCALSGTRSNDLVWIISVPERRRLVATATPAVGSALRPALALRTVCSAMDPNLNLACAYPATTGSIARLTLDAVDPGTYYLWVEGEDANSGAFTLDVQLEVPPPSESCAQPRQVTIGTNSEEILGDTRGQQDDAAGLCGGAMAPDAVYAVTLGSARRLRIELEGITKGFQPVLYARTACEQATAAAQVGCVASTDGKTLLDIPRVEAGTLFVFVDGKTTSAGNAGAYRLRITPFDPVPPPTNDVCSAAQVIVMPINAIGTVNPQGDTSSANNDAKGCNATGSDLVYQFTTPLPRQVLARVTPLAGSSLRPAVYLRAAGKCASDLPADQTACQLSAAAGAAATTVVPNLPAGTWFLWVDGVQGSSGPFDLKLEFAEPPPVPGNDVCGGAAPLDLLMNVVNAQGTTLGANADKASQCTIPENGATPDVVYEVTLASQQSLSIDLRATTGSALKPVATLRAGSCASINPTDRLSCAWGDPQVTDRAVVTVPSLDAGTYYLWVSGDDGSQGPFSLKVSAGAPIAAPANDDCSTTLPVLVPGVSLTGDTRAAFDDTYATSCGLPAGAEGNGARDVAYRFSLVNGVQTVTLSVHADPLQGDLFRPVIYVRTSSCLLPTAKGCAAASSYGGIATLTLNNLPAGSYTAWVDGAGQSSGKFTIKLQ